MPAKEISYQPKSITGAPVKQAPPIGSGVAIKQALEQKAAQGKFEAIQAGLGQPPAVQERFPEPGEVIQQALAKPVAQPKGGKKTAKNQQLPVAPAHAHVSTVEQLAGIPAPNDQPQLISSGQAGMVIAPPSNPAPTPPHTLRQYDAQFRTEGMPMPDVADIFMGTALGTAPILPVKAPEPPPTIVEHHVTITHEAPPKESAYIVIRKFSGFIGDSFNEYPAGKIIYNWNEIETILKGGGAECIQPLESVKLWMTCPSCKHQFPEDAGR